MSDEEKLKLLDKAMDELLAPDIWVELIGEGDSMTVDFAVRSMPALRQLYENRIKEKSREETS